MKRILVLVSIGAFLLLEMAFANNHKNTDLALEAILTAEHRTPAFIDRDAWRHPLETLTFFYQQYNHRP